MNAASGRGARARRGRVLLVGDVPEASRLGAMLAQPPSSTASMLEAIGEVTAGSAGDAVAAVIVSEAFLQPPHERAIEALRKVDPSVRVVASASSPTAPPAAATVKGVDAWLTLPLRNEDLRRALDDDGLLASAGAASTGQPSVVDLDDRTADGDGGEFAAPRKPQADRETPAQTSTLAREHSNAQSPALPPQLPSNDVPPAAVAKVSLGEPQLRPVKPEPTQADASRLSGPPGESPLAARVAPTPAGAVGDTDLIEAMLRDPQGLRALALRLIAHHGGWREVQIIDGTIASSPGAPAGAGVEIIHRGHRFGRLVAQVAASQFEADAARLKPWAEWIAHWLALEQEHRRFRQAAHVDDLTGAWNRRFFEAFLADAIARARAQREPVTVMVFDIDNFKQYNDQFGHDAGDDILREIVRLLKSIIRQGDVVCRIGGDEFVVVFADPEAPRTPGSKHPESVESIARRFQQAVRSMRFPKLGVEAPGTLSISAGLASYPWDGHDAAALLRHADHRALESKRRGKNAITLGPGIGGEPPSE